MARQNIFSKIYDVVGAMDGAVDNLDGTLEGKFTIMRKTNRKNISNTKLTFTFNDPRVSNLGFKKVSFKENSSGSLFGDFGDDDQLGNPIKVKSGNMKYDYLYNGVNSDILSSCNFSENNLLLKLAVFPKFIERFQDKDDLVRVKVNKKGKKKFKPGLVGNFRVNLDENFVAIATGKKNKFSQNLIARADLEDSYDFLNSNFKACDNIVPVDSFSS